MARTAEKLTDDVKQFITQLKLKEWKLTAHEVIREVRNYLISREQNLHPEANKDAIESRVDKAKLSPYGIIAFLTEINKNKPLLIDSNWSMACMNTVPIDPDALPWLIATQLNLRQYLARPLTVREAVWFGRLYGFRNAIKVTREIEEQNNADLERFYIRNVITEWSHLYAYREKIDELAAIGEPDYSDLDYSLANQDFITIYRYGDVFLTDKVKEFFLADQLEDLTKETLESWGKKYGLPHNIKQTRFIESRYLGHSLGEPNLESDSYKLYQQILAEIGNDELEYFEKYKKLSYMDRIEFFKAVRQVCKEKKTGQITTGDL